jgi:hypothetical protein
VNNVEAAAKQADPNTEDSGRDEAPDEFQTEANAGLLGT